VNSWHHRSVTRSSRRTSSSYSEHCYSSLDKTTTLNSRPSTAPMCTDLWRGSVLLCRSSDHDNFGIGWSPFRFGSLCKSIHPCRHDVMGAIDLRNISALHRDIEQYYMGSGTRFTRVYRVGLVVQIDSTSDSSSHCVRSVVWSDY
jgi:hypothetical protein